MPSTKQKALMGEGPVVQNSHRASAAPEKLPLVLREERAPRQGHQHEQTTAGVNPHTSSTYLHPLPVDFHEEDAERVGFGSDIPVQEVLAADGELHFADTVLGADGRRRRGAHGVRHGAQGSSSGHSVGQHRDKPQCWQAPNILSALLSWAHTAWPQAEPLALSHTRDLSHEASSSVLPPSHRCPEWEPSTAPVTCCEFAP